MKLVHLVGFIVKKFVTMHSHMNVKKDVCDVNLNTFVLDIFVLSVV